MMDCKLIPINTKKQRLVVYKKALKVIEADYERIKEDDCGHGLCILLKEISGRKFSDNSIPRTDKLYPEFGNFINHYEPIKYLKLLNDGSVTNTWRIKVLNQCIKLAS